VGWSESYATIAACPEESVRLQQLGAPSMPEGRRVRRCVAALAVGGVVAAVLARSAGGGPGGGTEASDVRRVVSAQEPERVLEAPPPGHQKKPDWIPAYTASTQTSTTSTRTSTTTTSTTTMPFKERPVSDGPSMYCFMVARMTGDEGDLVKCQFRRGAGIFGCNHFSVFSDTRFLFTLGPPVVQTYQLPLPVSTPMHVAGVETAGYLNTELFVRVWERLMGLPQVWSHDWIVKVDPDTVFFPYRLQRSLVHYGQGVAAYLRNCPGGPRGLEMFGAMEVISSRGLDAYRAGWTQCVERLQWNELGEDFFMQKCLDLLNVSARTNAAVFADAYCMSQAVDCHADLPAFHPFKKVESYFRCWEQSGGTTLSPKPGVAPAVTCAAPPWPAGDEPHGPLNGIRPPAPDQPAQPPLPPPPPRLLAPRPQPVAAGPA